MARAVSSISFWELQFCLLTDSRLLNGCSLYPAFIAIANIKLLVGLRTGNLSIDHGRYLPAWCPPTPGHPFAADLLNVLMTRKISTLWLEALQPPFLDRYNEVMDGMGSAIRC
jgi:hypothetical protein